MTVDLADEQKMRTRRLASLTQRHQVAFAAACAERLWPAYEEFVQANAWGDRDMMRRGLDVAWDAAAGDAPAGVSEMRRRCFAHTPHTEEFGSRLGGAASNAGSAIVTALHCAEKVDPDQAAATGSLVLSTARSYAYATGRQRSIEKAPPVAAERARQEEDLRALESDTPFPAAAVGRLRAAAREHALVDVARTLAASD
jgi:uncharacterized protein YjaG (DUF416 family)